MPSMKTTLDNLEHRYALLMEDFDKGDKDTKLALDEPLRSLEAVIFAAIREGWSKRSEQIETLTKSLKSATKEIRELKQSIDNLVKAAQLAASTLKTLAAIRAAL
jgi:hypothetical protein